jgi:hypothetical protein
MAGREMLPSEVGASRAEIGLPKMLQNDGFLDMNGILCRSRTMGLVSSRAIFRDLELLRGNAPHGCREMNENYHGWGCYFERVGGASRGETGERCKKGLHGPKHISSELIAELRTCETGCGETNIINQREGCDIEGYSPWVGSAHARKRIPRLDRRNRLSHCPLACLHLVHFCVVRV